MGPSRTQRSCDCSFSLVTTRCGVPSFTAYGKYATEEWRKLLDSGAVVEVTREEAANSPVEPCRLGIVLKGRDVFEACQAGIHLVDEQSVSTWDRIRRTRGLDAIKKRLICDASVMGITAL